MAAELRNVPVKSITVEKGANPREHFDDQAQKDLAASVKQHGVLQPVVLRLLETRKDGADYALVAGERRLRAAKAAKLAEIPAVIRADVNGDAGTLALVENLQREELSPIEQARAFQRALDAGLDVKKLAAVVSLSEATINGRLGLLALPETVQAGIQTGTVPLSAVKQLADYAAVSPAIAGAVATSIEQGRFTAADLERDPGDCISEALDDADRRGERIFYASTGRFPRFGELWVDETEAAELDRLANEAGLEESSPFWHRTNTPSPWSIDKNDVDAARAYGCLLDTQTDATAYWGMRLVTDKPWLLDRLKSKIERATKPFGKWLKEQGKPAPAAAGAGATAEERAAAAKAEAKKKRDKEKADQLAARERNITLGIALTKELHAPKLTEPALRLVAELLLAYAGDDLGWRGIRFTDEASQTVATRKDGTISRVGHVGTPTAARNLLNDRLAGAKTAEQILGVLLQAVVAAQFAEVKAAIGSQQWGSVRGLGRYAYGDAEKRIQALVDELGLPVLPPALRERAKKAAKS